MIKKLTYPPDASVWSIHSFGETLFAISLATSEGGFLTIFESGKHAKDKSPISGDGGVSNLISSMYPSESRIGRKDSMISFLNRSNGYCMKAATI